MKFLGHCWSLERDYPRLKKPDCCTSCDMEYEDTMEMPHDVETPKGFYQVCCNHYAASQKSVFFVKATFSISSEN